MLKSNATYLPLESFGQSVLRTDLITGIFTDVTEHESEMYVMPSTMFGCSFSIHVMEPLVLSTVNL